MASGLIYKYLKRLKTPKYWMLDILKKVHGTSRVEQAKDKIMESETFRNGYTPLHEAVRSRHVDVVKMLIEEDPKYSYTPDHREEVRETPLYRVARRGFDKMVDMNGYGVLWWRRRTEIFVNRGMEMEISLSYTSMTIHLDDYTGNKAIHIVASRDHVSVLKEIMLRCLDSWDVENYDYINILQIAVKHQQKNVIKYILEECPIIDSMINMKDYDGNTPLHLLSISNYSLPQFILRPMADKGVLNYDNMMPLDLVNNNVNMPMATKNEIVEELKNAGATVGLTYQRKVEKESKYKKKKKGEGEGEGDEAIMKELWERAQTHIVVTTLIATITFAAGFTMPGGFIQSGSPHQGMSLLTKSTTFQAFIIFDTIALVLSTSAIFIYFVASISTDWARISKLFHAGIYLNLFALLAMMVAFITGIYTVLANSLALAIATSLVGSCFFIVYIAMIVWFVCLEVL
ncbi:hypothetical protein LguiA_031025 [Lonicera macranthoides]